MELKPGDVVVLKSGGQPLTVAEVHGDNIACVWMGEEGDLFRETLPLAVLEVIEIDEDEDDDLLDDDAKLKRQTSPLQVFDVKNPAVRAALADAPKIGEKVLDPAAGTGGTYSLTFEAGNGVGTAATQSFTLTVLESATVSSGSSTTFTAGTSNSFPLTASGNLSAAGSAANLTTTSGGTTTLGPLTVSGNLSTTSTGNIGQAGPLTIGGAPVPPVKLSVIVPPGTPVSLPHTNPTLFPPTLPLPGLNGGWS